MKRWIHAATKSTFTGKQAAEMAKDFLEDLGFLDVKIIPQRGKPGTTGGSVTVSFHYSEDGRINDPNPEIRGYAESNNREFHNFLLAQELYGESAEGYFDPITHKGEGYKQLYDGICSDVENFFEEQNLDVEVGQHAGGLYGVHSYVNIKLFVPR